MNIGLFITHFPYRNQFTDTSIAEEYVCSGGEIAAYKFAVNLVRLGHKVVVFSSSKEGRYETEEYGGMNIYRYPARFRVGDTMIAPSFIWRPWFEKEQIDVVHVQHTTPPGGAAGLAYAKIKGKPLILTHHGFERYDGYGSLLRRILVYLSANLFVDFLLSSTDKIISISEHFKKESRFLQKYTDKTVVIPNGVDLDEFHEKMSREASRTELGLPVDKPILLFLGSLIPRKGVDVLLKAAAKVISKVNDLQVVIVGRGPLLKDLKSLSTALGIETNVRFEGFVADVETKNQYYCAADILVVPSLNDMEMFPLVLLEGAASGCAIVASDMETFRCIIEDGKTGIFSNSGDIDSLADKLLLVLQNDQLRTELGNNALENVRGFSWVKIAEETTEIYTSILEGETEK